VDFPRPLGPHDADELALFDVEGDAGEGRGFDFGGAVGFAEVIGLNHGVRGFVVGDFEGEPARVERVQFQ
jgi:hypothetical protein